MKSTRVVDLALALLLGGAACACSDGGTDGSHGETSTGGVPGTVGGDPGTVGTGGATTGDGGTDPGTNPATVGTDAGTATGGTSTATGGTDAGAATGGTSTATGGTESSTATGGTNTSTGGTDTGTASACSTTATVGLAVGDLIPDIELQHCDGSPVNLHDLACGNVLTQVYSYAGWCPGCRGFSGLEGDMGFTGNSLYESYHEDGYEQVIILGATANFTDPTTEDCAALQALHEGLVVFDATGSKATDVLGLQINGGTGLVDAQGLWVVAPPTDDSENGGMGAVFSELMNRFGFRG